MAAAVRRRGRCPAADLALLCLLIGAEADPSFGREDIDRARLQARGARALLS
ncbi:hypothetical protein [Streptomyces sp. NPDC015345]|uniref:hypothetical protein n=1 Tax=Streptomyces sp. NPDC015345 TaxID=3364953 RepID=UPI0036F54E9A